MNGLISRALRKILYFTFYVYIFVNIIIHLYYNKTHSSVINIQIILAFGMQCSFMRILIGSRQFNLVAAGSFAHLLGATGAAVSVFPTKVIVTSSIGFVVWRAGIFSKKAARLDL